MDLLKPAEVKINDMDGVVHTYTISRFPAVQGREIMTQYPISAIPKLGDYPRNQELMLKMMAFVGVKLGESGKMQHLTTQALVDNHVPDFETLMRLEAAMIEYNTTFFSKGTSSTFFDLIIQKAKPLTIAILTAWSEQSSQTEKPPSTN